MLSKQSATGNSATSQNHVFTDISPMPGLNFYRLKLVSLDGGYQYSSVKAVDFVADSPVLIFPNPTSGPIQIKNVSPLNLPVLFDVYNVGGQLVKQINAAQSQVDIGGNLSYDLSDLSNGIYFIHFAEGDVTKIVKLIVQH